MEKRKDIDEEVKKTMHSLNELKQARTDSYFITRLEARMDLKKPSFVMREFWAEPRYMLGAAAVFVIILFNLFSVIQYQQYAQAEKQEDIYTLSEEYEQDVPVLYDINEENDGY